MASRTITREQFDELLFACDRREFMKFLERYTGIESRPYTAYQYFDTAGDFLGNSDGMSLEDLLDKAEIEVIDDG